MKLSVLMPVYNEVSTVEAAVKRVLAVTFPCEIELVLVNDGSVDGTDAVLEGLSDPRLLQHSHHSNMGKGAAIRTAASIATGDYLIMCDADLEYAPEELPSLLTPVLDGEATIVYGTRSFGSHTAFSFWYVIGNKAVTFAANLLFDSWISDLETCFKLVPAELYRSMDIRSAGFGMEAEITGKLLRMGYRPYEVPISYKARTREAGKKLTWRDGVEALWILAKLRITAPKGAAAHVGR